MIRLALRPSNLVILSLALVLFAGRSEGQSPSDTKKKVDEFEKEAAELRDKAEEAIAAKRAKLLAELEALHKDLVRQGKTDDANAVKAQIARLEGKDKPNTNALLNRLKGKVKASASTTFCGWPVDKMLDGDPQTSWFSATGDAAAKGAKPWVELEFPDDETVRRVTVQGNREPDFPTGYSVLEGVVEFLDKDRKTIWSDEMKGAGDLKDFDFKPKKAVKGVRFVRFVSTRDEGDQNGFDDIALAEIMVE